MAEFLSVAITEAPSAKIAVLDSDEVGRSAMYNKFNNGPRTLPWGTPTLTAKSSVYSVNLYEGVSTTQTGLKMLQKCIASFQELHLSSIISICLFYCEMPLSKAELMIFPTTGKSLFKRRDFIDFSHSRTTSQWPVGC
jgi:hypothetical protein